MVPADPDGPARPDAAPPRAPARPAGSAARPTGPLGGSGTAGEALVPLAGRALEPLPDIDLTGSTDRTPAVGRTPAAELTPAAGAGAAPEEPDRPGPASVDADLRLSDVDEWGRSEQWRHRARTLFDPVYRHWFRAEWEGLEHIPLDGGALLVANHAGAIPSDAPVIMHGIETELGRPVYGLADHLFKGAPVVSTLWSRVGGVGAHPDNAYRLLREQGQLALVFPEGTKGPGKTYTDRYRLRRFGRGGFVEIAMRSGVPIVPIAVVGAEESMPLLWTSSALARLVRLPYAGVTANMAMFGPAGLVTYLPAKFKLRVLEPVRFDVPADQPRYSRSLIMDESEAIREQIQSALYDLLRSRRSVWFG